MVEIGQVLCTGRENTSSSGASAITESANSTAATGRSAAQKHPSSELPDSALDADELDIVSNSRRASEAVDTLQRSIGESVVRGDLPVFTQAAAEIDLLLGQLDQHLSAVTDKKIIKLVRQIQKTQRAVRQSSARADRWRKKATTSLRETQERMAKCQAELLIQVYTLKNRNITTHASRHATAASKSHQTGRTDRPSFRPHPDAVQVRSLVALMASPFLVPAR